MVEYPAHRSPRRCPTHPGAILKHDVLPALRIPLKRFAEHLGVSRTILYQLLNEQRSVSPGMAARLGLALGNTALYWLNLQANYDAWHAERESRGLKIERLHAARPRRSLSCSTPRPSPRP